MRDRRVIYQVRRAQAAGAAAVVIVNSSDERFIPQAVVDGVQEP